MNTRKLIHQSHDSYGAIQVYDDSERRYLHFGTDTEQTCILKRDPAQLQYDYTRAMLIPLLYMDNPKRALLLGLGAGSMAHCLKQHYPQMKITAVELRATVIDIAQRYFQLMPSKKLQLVADNALNFLQQQEPQKAELILSDLYGADDVDYSQLSADYLDLCLHHLHPQGWLVLNCWQHHRNQRDWINALNERFGYIAECTTQAGNWVILARRHQPENSKTSIKQRAAEWQRKAGFSLPLARISN